MARIKTFTNSGSLLPADLNTIQDDYEGAFSGWKPLFVRSGDMTSANGTFLSPLLIAGGDMTGTLTTTRASQALFLADPTSLAISPRVADLRLRVQAISNAVNPAATITVNLRGGSSVSFGASGAAAPLASSATVLKSVSVPATASATLFTPAVSASGPAGASNNFFYIDAAASVTLAANAVLTLIATCEYRAI